METLTTAPLCLHTEFTVETGHPTEFIDLTDRVTSLVVQGGLRFGFVNVQTRHTTTAILVNEHEPLLLSDFAAFLERLAPRGAIYRHDDETVRTVNLTPDERHNGHSHCRALLLPLNATLNVVDGQLRLGRWQRLFLVELDGPRPRSVSVMLMGEGWR